jgi:glucose-6-phosphate isomerase
MDQIALWERYRRELIVCDEAGLTLDTSRISFAEGFHERLAPLLSRAFDDMDALEKGAIANPDEKRMVGHYWLRDPQLAPDPAVRDAISQTLERIVAFAADVHAGKIAPERGGKFEHVLVVGIGGSALGPQLAASALGGVGDPMKAHFIDNTDPDGIDRVIARLGADIARTLTVVMSKSGGTKETRNGTLEAKAAYEAAGLSFGKHVIAVTGEGSELDKLATREGWITRFPMWDWVGGRTSELSAVGLVPAALQGVDVRALLEGARVMDSFTRARDGRTNPAAAMALAWYNETGGQGRKDMVILPYKDRLELTSRYLQQLVMESLGKEHDLDGKVVNQGIAVYGNKGSTDQHAYVQQLRDGVPNFYVVFIEVLRDRAGKGIEVEPGVTAGDYLEGFLLGTRTALHDKGRASITLTLDEVSPRSLGALIALFERAVGYYATLVNINAYHQPGVEAGKKAAAEVLALQLAIVPALTGTPASADEIARAVGKPEQAETAFKILEHLAANPGRGVVKQGGRSPDKARFLKGLRRRRCGRGVCGGGGFRPGGADRGGGVGVVAHGAGPDADARGVGRRCAGHEGVEVVALALVAERHERGGLVDARPLERLDRAHFAEPEREVAPGPGGQRLEEVAGRGAPIVAVVAVHQVARRRAYLERDVVLAQVDQGSPLAPVRHRHADDHLAARRRVGPAVGGHDQPGRSLVYGLGGRGRRLRGRRGLLRVGGFGFRLGRCDGLPWDGEGDSLQVARWHHVARIAERLDDVRRRGQRHLALLRLLRVRGIRVAEMRVDDRAWCEASHELPGPAEDHRIDRLVVVLTGLEDERALGLLPARAELARGATDGNLSRWK